MEPKMPHKADPLDLSAPTYRIINYEITNLELGKAITKALEGASEPSADVYVGKTPEREGWAIHMLFVRGAAFDFESGDDQRRLVMHPKWIQGTWVDGTPGPISGTYLRTQRGRVMTWTRLETLLIQVQKWVDKEQWRHVAVSLKVNSLASIGGRAA